MMTSPILIVHRSYTHKGGEDLFLDETLVPALAAAGLPHEVLLFEALFKKKARLVADLAEVACMALGWERLRPSYFKIQRKIARTRPSAVIFNNYIPTLSLAAGTSAQNGPRAPRYLWVHNGRLSCANGLFYDGEKTCHQCFDQGSRSVLSRKCFGSRKQSWLYSWIYRKQRVFRHVSKIIDGYFVCSNYSGAGISRLTQLSPGFRPPIHLVRPPVPPAPLLTEAPSPGFLHALRELPQPFYAFVGRVSIEKGADRLVDFAIRYPDRGFVIAGSGPLLDSIRASAPRNLFCAGFVSAAEKSFLYEKANAVLVPSRVPENASLVIMESETYRTPVVYPEGGGAEELVQFFKRPSCPLGKFSGQVFQRDDRPPTDWSLAAFGNAIAKVVHSDRAKARELTHAQLSP